MGNKKLAASKKKSTALKNTASHKTDQVELSAKALLDDRSIQDYTRIEQLQKTEIDNLRTEKADLVSKLHGRQTQIENLKSEKTDIANKLYNNEMKLYETKRLYESNKTELEENYRSTGNLVMQLRHTKTKLSSALMLMKIELESRLKEKEMISKRQEENLLCGVCLTVPRSRRIPVCRNGHITCQGCKRNTCPICRVSTTVESFSVIARNIADLLELECVNHGCTVRLLRPQIIQHEKDCLYKTDIECPYHHASGCNEKLSYFNFLNHFLQTHGTSVGRIECDKSYTSYENATQVWNLPTRPLQVIGTNDHVFLVSKIMGNFVGISFKCLSSDRQRRYKIDLKLLDSKSGQSFSISGETLLMTETLQTGLNAGNVLPVHSVVYNKMMAGGGVQTVFTLTQQHEAIMSNASDGDAEGLDSVTSS